MRDPIRERLNVVRSRTAAQVAKDRQRHAQQVDRRLSRAAAPLVSVTVLGNGPVSHAGAVYYEGEEFALPDFLAENLIASGRVELAEED